MANMARQPRRMPPRTPRAIHSQVMSPPLLSGSPVLVLSGVTVPVGVSDVNVVTTVVDGSVVVVTTTDVGIVVVGVVVVGEVGVVVSDVGGVVVEVVVVDAVVVGDVDGITTAVHPAYRVIFDVTGVLKSYALLSPVFVYQPSKV